MCSARHTEKHTTTDWFTGWLWMDQPKPTRSCVKPQICYSRLDYTETIQPMQDSSQTKHISAWGKSTGSLLTHNLPSYLLIAALTCFQRSAALRLSVLHRFTLGVVHRGRALLHASLHIFWRAVCRTTILPQSYTETQPATENTRLLLPLTTKFKLKTSIRSSYRIHHEI